ncbi:MAG: 50S ribosomal protein L34, partial [Pseudomonas sp.]|nr:50S ribosomal protein L34 [Pseudomonas sp.]
RMATRGGRMILARRRAKGRYKLTVSDDWLRLAGSDVPIAGKSALTIINPQRHITYSSLAQMSASNRI